MAGRCAVKAEVNVSWMFTRGTTKLVVCSQGSALFLEHTWMMNRYLR